MSSGQVYFWHMETNEVVWDPPEGSRPRSDEEKAFLAQASDDPQPASGSNVQLPVRDSEAADVHRGVADEEDKYLSTAGEEPDSDHVMEDSLNLNRVQEVGPAVCPQTPHWCVAGYFHCYLLSSLSLVEATTCLIVRQIWPKPNRGVLLSLCPKYPWGVVLALSAATFCLGPSVPIPSTVLDIF